MHENELTIYLQKCYKSASQNSAKRNAGNNTEVGNLICVRKTMKMKKIIPL